MQGSQLMPSAASADGRPSELSLTTSSPGVTYPFAAGALARLLRLQQPPPTSTLQSRIRSAASSLPGQPLTAAILVAMVDLIHDRLQQLRPHESSWATARDAVLKCLNAGDFPSINDYDNYPSSATTASSTVEWKPIHPGHMQIHRHVVADVLAAPSRPADSSFHVGRPTRPSTSMDACLDNLVNCGVIQRSAHHADPTMSLFLKPKDAFSARVICDLRPLNGMYTRKPPSFSLPSIPLICAITRSWPACFYTKLDVSAYFHSLSLHPTDKARLSPAGLTGEPFTFQYGGSSWTWLRLPFGWSWAPVLAQHVMEQLVREALQAYPDVLGPVYYDDVLLLGSDPDRLREATLRCVRHLELHNLRLSYHKCVLEPALTIEWIGKSLRHHAVSNSQGRTRQVAGLFAGVARCFHTRPLRRLLGWTQWFCSHFPGATRCLHPLYALLHTPEFTGIPWSGLWAFAMAVALGSCSVAWPRPASLHILHADACAAKGTVGICNYDGSEGCTLEIPPQFLAEYVSAPRAQQTSELYGTALVIACAALSGHNLLLFSDSSACVGWFSGLRLPPTRHQAQLLLAAATLQTLCAVDCTLRWVPSELNLADSWSRKAPRARGE